MSQKHPSGKQSPPKKQRSRYENKMGMPLTKSLSTRESKQKKLSIRSREKHSLAALDDRKAAAPKLDELSDQLLLKIFSYLKVTDLMKMFFINKHFNALAHNNNLWQKQYMIHIGKLEYKRSVMKSSQYAFGLTKGKDYWKKLFYTEICSRHIAAPEYFKWKMFDRVLELPSNAMSYLERNDVCWMMYFVTEDGIEGKGLENSETVIFRGSLSIKWQRSRMPNVDGLKEIRIYAIVPVFRDKAGKSISMRPYKRFFFVSQPFETGFQHWLATSTPVNESMQDLSLYTLPCGLKLAMWKYNLELVFVVFSIHWHKLITHFYNCSREIYVGRDDDIVPNSPPFKNRPSYNAEQPKETEKLKLRNELTSVPVKEIDTMNISNLSNYKCAVDLRTNQSNLWFKYFPRLVTNLAQAKKVIKFQLVEHSKPDKPDGQNYLLKHNNITYNWNVGKVSGELWNLCELDVTFYDSRDNENLTKPGPTPGGAGGTGGTGGIGTMAALPADHPKKVIEYEEDKMGLFRTILIWDEKAQKHRISEMMIFVNIAVVTGVKNEN
ncbi:hypothetical protein HELRODRAFT_177285 [Helobdella robusta]|uniref:F-box domain-containing protein n=1 Tax=Helobdella robusta TaxID=6412 RepID=T1FBG3_HELRO|nr:hypothetical protein HELRODRAFT_177285 [Helobdella robusta]ESN98054.1 hypothetical protein HELRODRAFT_177285 [Helobdella robusta]